VGAERAPARSKELERASGPEDLRGPCLIVVVEIAVELPGVQVAVASMRGKRTNRDVRMEASGGVLEGRDSSG
jgi:hypothetical protein